MRGLRAPSDEMRRRPPGRRVRGQAVGAAAAFRSRPRWLLPVAIIVLVAALAGTYDRHSFTVEEYTRPRVTCLAEVCREARAHSGTLPDPPRAFAKAHGGGLCSGGSTGRPATMRWQDASYALGGLFLSSGRAGVDSWQLTVDSAVQTFQFTVSGWSRYDVVTPFRWPLSLGLALVALARAGEARPDVRRRARTAVVGDPQLSPDGKQILFTIDSADWKPNRRVGHIYQDQCRRHQPGAAHIRRSWRIEPALVARWQVDRVYHASRPDTNNQIYVLVSRAVRRGGSPITRPRQAI